MTGAAAMRRIAAWAGVIAIISLGVAWRVAGIRTQIAAEVDTNHAVTTAALAVRVAEWGRVRSAHAEAVAALLVDDFGMPGAAAAARRDARFARALAVLVRHDVFRGGRVELTDGIRDTAPPVRIRVVPCSDAFCAEFEAPVRRAGRRVGAIVLVAAIDDSTFRPLNAIRPRVRTARASVLAPLGSADAETIAVVASLGAAGTPEPSPQRDRRSLPVSLQRMLAGTAGTEVAPGVGLHGRPVRAAAVAVPTLGWVVVRELDRAEIGEATRRVAMIEEPILITLLLVVAGLARYWVGAARARREREVVRLRADFVASASHELRTPLAQIRLFADLLQQKALRDPDDTARALRVIEKEAGRLTILVDNLLNYTRLRRHADDVTLDAVVPTAVDEEVDYAIGAFAPLAADRQVRVVADVPPDLRIQVDSLAFRQVLVNYLENAVKYGPPGQTVTVGASADERTVRITVDDQGGGVPPNERATIWEPFRRGAGAESSTEGGSGIGLAVVREIAAQYDGEALVERAPAGGARFVFAAPRALSP